MSVHFDLSEPLVLRLRVAVRARLVLRDSESFYNEP